MEEHLARPGVQLVQSGPGCRWAADCWMKSEDFSHFYFVDLSKINLG